MEKGFNKLSLGIIALVLVLFSFGCVRNAEHPLVGVWKLEGQSGDQPVVCYKLLNKDGTYVNLRSTDLAAGNFAVTRQGKFTTGVGEYVEHLMEEHGRKFDSPVYFPLRYEFLSKDTVRISFRIGEQQYNEVWHKAKKAPEYQL